jgi:sortase A
MKRKTKPSAAVPALLIAAGLSLLIYPTLRDAVTRLSMSRKIAEYNTVVAAEKPDYSGYWEEADEYNAFLRDKKDQFIFEEGERERLSLLLDPAGTGMTGVVEIPKISLTLPFYRGIDEASLQSGAGFWQGTSIPTGEPGTHCVISAHSGLVKARLFSDLDRLEIGDRFTITVLDRTLAYEVDKITVAEPEDGSGLRILPDEALATLYTCTPYGINTHRLLVRGRRVTDIAITGSDFAARAGKAEPADYPLYAVFAASGTALAASAVLCIIQHLREKKQRI